MKTKIKKAVKQTTIVLVSAFVLAAWGNYLFHDERLGNQSTKTFYKTPSDLTEAVGELK